jgi:putative sigma-54 modulation protein
MNLNIKTQNVSLTPAISDYLEKKLRMIKGLDLDKDNIFIYAEIGKTTQHHRSGDVYKAEVNIDIAGKNMYAMSEMDDLYAAIDDVKDDLSREMKTFKGKQRYIRKYGKVI